MHPWLKMQFDCNEWRPSVDEPTTIVENSHSTRVLSDVKSCGTVVRGLGQNDLC